MSKYVALNVPVTLGTTVLTDHAARVQVELSADSVDATAFGGNGWRENLPGLKSGSISIDFQADHASGSVNAVIAGYFGGTAPVIVGGTAMGTTALGTATCVINDYKPHPAAVGDLATMQITWPITGAPVGFGLS